MFRNFLLLASLWLGNVECFRMQVERIQRSSPFFAQTSFPDEVLTQLQEISQLTAQNPVESSSKTKVWTSSKSSANGNSGNSNNKPASTWKPKGAPSGGPGGGGKSENRWQGGGDREVKLLTEPLLHIRYRVPRAITPEKQVLIDQQVAWKEIDSERASERADRGYGGGGGGGRKFSNGNNFNPMSMPIIPDGPQRRGQQQRGKSSQDQRMSEERAKRSLAVKRKERGTEDDGDDSALDFSDDRDDSDLDIGTYRYADLESIPDDDFITWIQEGLEVEDVREKILLEYGIKCSFSGLKTRMFVAKDEMRDKFKNRSGKTRRERTKAKNAKYAPKEDTSVVLPPDEQIQVRALAELIDVGSGELVKHLMVNEGVLLNMNMMVTREMAVKLIEAFGKTVAGADKDDNNDVEEEVVEKSDAQALQEKHDKQQQRQLLDGVWVPRTPVVTIMGHVDHGKTTLLDKIRNTRVAASEAGGITQGISAFNVLTGGDGEGTSKRNITFIDTPGHAAFSEMRKRGAKMTDIVVLVIAADDGVMEQTKECIQAAKLANCPIVVAVNKVDKEGADADRVKQELLQYGIMLEEFGGEVQSAMISAKSGQGLDDLLEKILLQAEVMTLKADVSAPFEGTVVEGSIDKGLGAVATAITTQGKLTVGSYIVAGAAYGRVRALINDQGKNVKETGPSLPVRIVGLNRVPSAGETIVTAANEEEAKEMAEARLRFTKNKAASATSAAFLAGMAQGVLGGTGYDNRQIIKLPIVIKADLGGSLEAITSSLLSAEMTASDDTAIAKLDVVFGGVGDVTTSDVSLAQAAKARVLAFNVAASSAAMDEARACNTQISYHNVLYDLLDEMKALIDGTITPPAPGIVLGQAVVKKIFKIGKTGKVAGCMVESGRILSGNSMVRVLRGKTAVFSSGIISTLKVVKEDAEEVPAGSECGISIKGFEDFEEGDIIESYRVNNESEDSTGSISSKASNTGGSSGKGQQR